MKKFTLLWIFLLSMLVTLSACSRANHSAIESSSSDTVVTTDFVEENKAPQHNQMTIVTSKDISIAIPNEWYNQVTVNPKGNFYLTDQTLFAIFHADTCAENELGWIFSICRYTEEEYEELFLQSQSKQYVFAKDDSSYYCVLLPTDVQSDSPDVNAFMDSIRENEIKGILDDMIRRNDLEQY